MEGGAHPCIRVESVECAADGSEDIVIDKFCGTQVLTGGEENVAGHGYHLRDDDIAAQIGEILNVVKEEVGEGAEHQGIPPHIGNNEPLTKGNEVIKGAVDAVTILGGDEVLCEKIEKKIAYPTQEQQHMAVTRGGNIVQTQATIVNNGTLHGNGGHLLERFCCIGIITLFFHEHKTSQSLLRG